MEQALWKVVYYRSCEEFRRRIRLASEAGDRGREPLRKVNSCHGSSNACSHAVSSVVCSAKL